MIPIHQKRITVSFSPTVRVVEVMGIEDYTPSEIAASWYSAEECDRITDRCAKLVMILETEGSKAKKYCIRGIERHTTVGSMAKNMNRTTAIAAVLDEQERQWNGDNEIDAQKIAEAYKRTTSSCQMWAQVMGNRDQAVAEAILFEQEEGEACSQETTVTAAILSRKSHQSPTLVSSLKHVQKAVGVAAAA